MQKLREEETKECIKEDLNHKINQTVPSEEIKTELDTFKTDMTTCKNQ